MLVTLRQKAGQPSELAVFLMTTQEHYELLSVAKPSIMFGVLIASLLPQFLQPTAEADVQPDLKSLMKMPSGFIISMTKAKLIRSRFLIINGF